MWKIVISNKQKPVEWPEWSHNNMIKCTESKEFIKKLEEGAQCLPTGWRFSIESDEALKVVAQALRTTTLVHSVAIDHYAQYASSIPAERAQVVQQVLADILANPRITGLKTEDIAFSHFPPCFFRDVIMKSRLTNIDFGNKIYTSPTLPDDMLFVAQTHPTLEQIGPLTWTDTRLMHSHEQKTYLRAHALIRNPLDRSRFGRFFVHRPLGGFTFASQQGRHAEDHYFHRLKRETITRRLAEIDSSGVRGIAFRGCILGPEGIPSLKKFTGLKQIVIIASGLMDADPKQKKAKKTKTK